MMTRTGYRRGSEGTLLLQLSQQFCLETDEALTGPPSYRETP